MPIYIEDTDVDEAMKAIGSAQPVPVKKNAVATAILRNAAEEFQRRRDAGDAGAWQVAAPASFASAQQNTDRPSAIRDDQPNPAQPCASDVSRDGDSNSKIAQPGKVA